MTPVWAGRLTEAAAAARAGLAAIDPRVRSARFDEAEELLAEAVAAKQGQWQ